MKVSARNILLCALSLPAAFFSFTSCERSRDIPSLEENEVFTLNYGNFEDEINLFDMAKIGNVNTNIAMRDGFFYIANGESRKIMEMNSYGDLLTLYFNEDFNPRPSFYDEEAAAVTTRKAIPYAFNSLSSIAVDNRKYVYVVDKMPPERQEMDEENGVVLSQIVLRFDTSGKFLGYIGQQGPGGTPFCYIKKIYTTENSQLVVVCTTPKGTMVYWFSEDGYILYKVPVDLIFERLYQNENMLDNWKVIENVIPDASKPVLYLKIDNFSNYIDDASRMQSGINYDGTEIVPLNLDRMTLGETLVIPSYNEQVTEGFSNESYKIPYDFVGITDNGWMFFVISTESGFSIQMIQSDGQKILKRNLTTDHAESLYYNFCLSNTGILAMLDVRNENAVVQWWRTDSLIQSVVKN